MRKNSRKKSQPKKTKKKTVKRKKSVKEKKEMMSGDIIQLILRDHQPLKEWIEVLKDEDASFSEKKSIYEQFSGALAAHATAEQESLYLNMKNADELRMEALEGDTEHAVATRLMEEIEAVGTDDEDLWSAKVKVLAEVVEHHIEEEEEEILKDVKKRISVEERVQIGAEYSRLIGHDSFGEMYEESQFPQAS